MKIGTKAPIDIKITLVKFHKLLRPESEVREGFTQRNRQTTRSGPSHSPTDLIAVGQKKFGLNRFRIV